MQYDVAEIFTSVQGEGVHTGVPMTFIRLVGCTVGKTICHFCDTDFDKAYPWKGGGRFRPSELIPFIHAKHVCISGGEPFNWDLRDLWHELRHLTVHVETSGTVLPEYLVCPQPYADRTYIDHDETAKTQPIWITVSPKPGYLGKMIDMANEIKVIVPGLGNDERWPTLVDAKHWASIGKPVYLQPRNHKDKIDPLNLALVNQLVLDNPELRLSTQVHKFLNVR